MSLDCDEEGLETDNSVPQNEHTPLSLLSFADMALALEAHKHEKDHTYAMNDTPEVELTDYERLLNKEKDHNYSHFSKTLQTRGRAKMVQFPIEPRRSSSEENLNRTGSTCSDKMCSQDFPVAFVSRKSHSLEKMTTRPSDLTGHPFSNSITVSADSEEQIFDEKILGSSWPQEASFETLRKRERLPKSRLNSLSSNYCDHTYARELSVKNNSCKIHDCTNTINSKTPLKTDHTYFDFSQKNLCICGSKFVDAFKIDSDHNYTASNSINVSELNSPWIPLRRDHTYSIF